MIRRARPMDAGEPTTGGADFDPSQLPGDFVDPTQDPFYNDPGTVPGYGFDPQFTDDPFAPIDDPGVANHPPTNGGNGSGSGGSGSGGGGSIGSKPGSGSSSGNPLTDALKKIFDQPGASAATVGGIFALLAGLLQHHQKSFAGTGADPVTALTNFYNKTNALEQHIANQHIQLPDAVVQTPGAISGEGLPMSFGLSGHDPALDHPEHLTLEGLTGGASSPLASMLPPLSGASPSLPSMGGSASAASIDSNQAPPADNGPQPLSRRTRPLPASADDTQSALTALRMLRG